MESLCFILVIAASASALTFDCDFVVTEWMAIGMNYQCQTKPSNVESSQHVTNVTGHHLYKKTNEDVIAIHISNCTDLSYIPKGLLHFFPNLVGIYMDSCGIFTLNGTELMEYPQLKLFAMEKSPLHYVPENFFAHNRDLRLISFVENKINGTGKNLLSNLTQLSEVYLEKNVCIDGNATTKEEVFKLNEKLNRDCSSVGSHMPKTLTLTFVLIGLALSRK